MKIIYTADLHDIEGLYSQLFRHAINWRADVIIIGGDLLPKHGAFSTSVEDQRDFIIRFMKPKLEEIHGELPGLEVYAMMGNDDCAQLEAKPSGNSSKRTSLTSLCTAIYMKLLHVPEVIGIKLAIPSALIPGKGPWTSMLSCSNWKMC